jgi:hypothetical protein
MPSPDDTPKDGIDGAAEELTVHMTVNGTTVMAAYVVEGAAVLLASADFGEASAALDGQAPKAVAARLLRGMAEAAMARSDVPFMRDDEANVPDA